MAKGKVNTDSNEDGTVNDQDNNQAQGFTDAVALVVINIIAPLAGWNAPVSLAQAKGNFPQVFERLAAVEFVEGGEN